jgi:hypothetical protein
VVNPCLYDKLTMVGLVMVDTLIFMKIVGLAMESAKQGY